MTARPAGVLEHRDVVRLDHPGHAHRGGRDPLVGTLLGERRGLDVHLHLGPPERVPHRLLDLVGDLVHLLDPLEPRDADDDVGEALATRLAHAHRAHLGHAGDAAHDTLDQAGEARRRPVHEHIHVAAAQPHRGDEHDRGDEDRGDRVAAGDARRGEPQADEHGHGAREVRPEVPRRLRSARRFAAAGPCAATPSPGSRRGRARRASTTNTYGRGLTGELPDCSRRTASTAIQTAAAERKTASPSAARCWALPCPYGMLAIGRALGDTDRVQGQDGRHRIDAGVRRFGQHAEAAAREPDHELDHHQDDGGHQRDQRRAPRDRHARDCIARRVSFFRPEVQ